MPQNVFLIDDEIKRNIAFGIKEKDIDESKNLTRYLYGIRILIILLAAVGLVLWFFL